jgi:hypothetical protein
MCLSPRCSNEERDPGLRNVSKSPKVNVSGLRKIYSIRMAYNWSYGERDDRRGSALRVQYARPM